MPSNYSRSLVVQIATASVLTLYFLAASAMVVMANPPQSFAPVVTGVTLKNPLAATSITAFLEGIVAIVLVLAIPILVFFIIYAGFLYVTARGNPQKVTEAHKALGYALLGGVLILGSYAIATIIGNIVRSFQAP